MTRSRHLAERRNAKRLPSHLRQFRMEEAAEVSLDPRVLPAAVVEVVPAAPFTGPVATRSKRNRRVARTARPQFEALDRRELLSTAMGAVPKAVHDLLTTHAVTIQQIPKRDGALQTSLRTQAVHSTAAPQGAVAFTGTVHIQDLGDQPLRNDTWAGTKGQSRRLEGIQVDIPPEWRDRLGLQYMAHLQGIGDTSWVSSGTFLGTRGQSRRVEGLAFRLTGPDAANYNVYYKVHLQDIGDTSVFVNGQFAGTRGQSRRLEAVIVSIVPKGSDPFPVDPSAPRDLRGTWAGSFEGLLRSETPSTFRDKVQLNRFVYDPVNDRVDFSAEMVWTKKIKFFGTTITIFTISCTAEGFVNLRNPTTLTFRVGRGDVRFNIPLVGSFDTYQVKQAIAGWFSQNAAAIRST